MPADDYKPDGWEQVIPERQTVFDPKKRLNYSVNRDKTIRWHGVPEGFKFDKDGVLHPVEEPVKPENTEKTDG